METLSPNIATHIPFFGKPSPAWWGKSMDDNLFMNITLRAAVHLGKDYDANFRYVKNHFRTTAGQLFQGNRKAGQWSDRNRWHKRDWFPRFEVDVDKLVAQLSLSIFYCQSLRVLHFCTRFGQKGRQSCWILEEQNSMVFGQQLCLRFEANWWTIYGIRVEDVPRTHYSGNPQSDSTDDGLITVWTRELHRQDHLHVNV